MRIAAIDIGTNSIHMIIARAHPRGRYEIVDSAKEMVRLGPRRPDRGRAHARRPRSRHLGPAPACSSLAKVRGTEEIIAVATSAVREAQNGGEFFGPHPR